MAWASTQAFNKATIRRTRDPYSGLLVKESHFDQIAEELVLQGIWADVEWVYRGDTKKVRALFNELDLFKEEGMNNFSICLFEVTHAYLPEALRHQLQIVIKNSRFEIARFLSTLTFHGAVSNGMADVPSVAVLVLKRIFGSTHFRPTARQRNSFCLY